jgi:hypothetical protein
MTKRSDQDEPEPIDAEFEPAHGPEPARPRRTGPRPMRSRSATRPELLIASVVAAVLGATVAIVVSNASSGAPTGTLAREIDNLVRSQDDLTARAEQAAADVVSLRSRLDAQGERLDQQDLIEAALRTDLVALTSQLSAISGASDGSAPAGTDAAKSPLGVLLGRINRLEGIVADDKTAPETTREVQRAIADLSAQVAALDQANTTLVTAFDRREAALAALEAGMQTMSSDLVALRGGRPPAPRAAGVALTAAEPVAPVLSATARSQEIRALSALEAAARGDRPFSREHQALTVLLPDDPALSEMAEAARRGVPTLAQLRADFAAAADEAHRAATNESDDGWNWLRQAFTGVVAFDPPPLVTSNADTVRNARRQLEIGDVRGALEAVTGVKGRAEGAFRSWRVDAIKRAELDERVRTLNARLLGTATSGGTAG